MGAGYWPVSTPVAGYKIDRGRNRLRTRYPGYRDGIGRPRIWEDMAMRFSSLFVASPAVLSIALLLCGPGSTAMSQTATQPGDATTSLHSLLVEAPKRVARPQRPQPHAVASSTASPRISPTPAAPSASPLSAAARLAKLANATGSCVGGCVTSFRSGDAPWHGCSFFAGTYSTTCRNTGNYKTYAECKEAGLITGWRDGETSWYCSSLALK